MGDRFYGLSPGKLLNSKTTIPTAMLWEKVRIQSCYHTLCKVPTIQQRLQAFREQESMICAREKSNQQEVCLSVCLQMEDLAEKDCNAAI